MSRRVSTCESTRALLGILGLATAALVLQGRERVSLTWLGAPAPAREAPAPEYLPLDPNGSLELPLVPARSREDELDTREEDAIDLELGEARVYRWSDRDWIAEVDVRAINYGSRPVRVGRDLLQIEGAWYAWGPVTSFDEAQVAPGATVTGTVGWFCSRDLPRPEAIRITRRAAALPPEPVPEAAPEPLPESPGAAEPDRGPVPWSGLALGSIAPGDPVLAEQAGQWWRAHVLEADGGDFVRIHYDGWEDSWDELVDRTRLAPR